MTIEEKQEALSKMHKAFGALITEVMMIPGNMAQKNQAILRFDEGHMWMQNAIMTYKIPQEAEIPQTASEAVIPNVGD